MLLLAVLCDAHVPMCRTTFHKFTQSRKNTTFPWFNARSLMAPCLSHLSIGQTSAHCSASSYFLMTECVSRLQWPITFLTMRSGMLYFCSLTPESIHANGPNQNDQLCTLTPWDWKTCGPQQLKICRRICLCFTTSPWLLWMDEMVSC